MDEQNKNPQQEPTPAQPAENGDQGNGRMFTQEEVNNIVRDRLARERAKSEPKPEDERERALNAREARMDCREYLQEQKLPAGLVDLLDSSNVDSFKTAVGTLLQLCPQLSAIEDNKPKFVTPPPYAPGPGTAPFFTSPSTYAGTPDSVAEAFKAPKVNGWQQARRKDW